jgi:hypothetical protein
MVQFVIPSEARNLLLRQNPGKSRFLVAFGLPAAGRLLGMTTKRVFQQPAKRSVA